MKVLHILGMLRPSGAETMLRLAAPYWFEAGLELAILSTGEAVGPYAAELENAGYEIFHLPFSKTIKFCFKFWQLLKNNNFDIVHIHTERAFPLYALIAWLRKTRMIVRTIHTSFSFSGFTRFSRTIFRWFLKAINVKQVSIGQGVYENELRIFDNNTYIIKNWFDSDRFKLPNLSEKKAARYDLGIKNQKVLISIGNCADVKNHQLILKAIRSVKNIYPEILYLHVGEEDEERTERQLAQELGILENVRFVGWQSDIYPYLLAADVFIMPSRYEGFSIAALEAVACGLPTILTDVPGLSDWKSLGMDSIIYTQANPEELSKNILTMLHFPIYPTKAQTEMIKSEFGVERGASEYLNLYKSSGFKS